MLILHRAVNIVNNMQAVACLLNIAGLVILADFSKLFLLLLKTHLVF